jgi:hypothetical protein
VPATDALALHWTTGQADVEDQNLAALLAWIDPDPRHTTRAQRLDAVAAAETRAWGPLRDPEDDELLAELVADFNRLRDNEAARQRAAGRIRDAVLPELVDAYRGAHRAIALLGTLRPAGSVTTRWGEDLRQWARHALRCDADVPPRFRARDEVDQAHRAVVDLERAVEAVPAQLAFDDELIMAEYVVAGQAFAGETVAVDLDNRETKPGNRNRSLVPLVTVRTLGRPPLPIGAKVWWTGDSRVGAEIRAVTPTVRRAGDPADDRPYAVQVALIEGHLRGTRAPAVGTGATFTVLEPNPQPWAPRLGPIPWTHRASPQEAA